MAADMELGTSAYHMYVAHAPHHCIRVVSVYLYTVSLPNLGVAQVPLQLYCPEWLGGGSGTSLSSQGWRLFRVCHSWF